jgi:ElaB/YqjD/DUF883 family membrane-anchored ribosome-binding protein
MIDRIEERAASTGFEAQLDAVKEQALISAATARERLTEARDQLRQFIVNNPVQALGIALGVGVALGWLIKRR